MAIDDPRFGGIARLYGTEALARLQASHVAVVGIGGVGSWAAEALARTGLGRITLIDMDDICVTNTNRQLPAMKGNIGRLKVEVMAERLQAINPACEVRPIMGFVTPDTLAEYITDDIDCVVDCIDSVASKVALIAWCRRRKIGIVTTGGAGGQIDPTMIKVADLSKTVNDPLAAKARSLLRRDHYFPRADSKRSFGVPCVYSTEQLRYPKPDGSVCQQKTFVGEGVKLDCSGGFGSVTMVTATFGMVAASKAVERLLR
ncbi:tRNA cyclic N6-threonylcarbamoyladenosine(37) synthase TcdA [Halopseudomonas bauzanensis]|uniref:tRNA threonylcarbamoyladenosine dehydratase n=1 Tax=Halopseudomonas bauzanensis TaxID=653930 RepID=A0A1H9VUY3_9GAMM|nr:tRNA cyclic N6-threonylcarbamoyladenosine(37) synthase TcdA [Halopseudomonas bauzanensis]SES25338.1 tRNA A37 threonylcarbamoyladenosine dehydratase [Halopseudomonas bauzanensis]SFM25230.1 tRNA A37 threonylcarbamoyladenosine dehydratase [Halopseudomonas bauzanensis]